MFLQCIVTRDRCLSRNTMDRTRTGVRVYWYYIVTLELFIDMQVSKRIIKLTSNNLSLKTVVTNANERLVVYQDGQLPISEFISVQQLVAGTGVGSAGWTGGFSPGVFGDCGRSAQGRECRDFISKGTATLLEPFYASPMEKHRQAALLGAFFFIICRI